MWNIGLMAKWLWDSRPVDRVYYGMEKDTRPRPLHDGGGGVRYSKMMTDAWPRPMWGLEL